jgi:hypothetical protein
LHRLKAEIVSFQTVQPSSTALDMCDITTYFSALDMCDTTTYFGTESRVHWKSVAPALEFPPGEIGCV